MTKFKYGDKVKVIAPSFYRGQRGVINHCITETSGLFKKHVDREYWVVVDDTLQTYLPEEYLELDNE